MKKILFLFATIILSSFATIKAQAEDLVLKGTYQGENIYVKNPFAPSGVGFCAYEVTVNGMITTDEINSSAFEIDLSVYGFAIGDDVTIVIRYKEDCTPMILNASALQVHKTAKFESISINGDELYFSTSGETGSLPFIVEQYRWNKWIKAAEVRGKGRNVPNTYSVKVSFHSGANKFRVRQSTNNRKVQSYSKEVVYIQPSPAVTYKITNDEITFSAETMYELYDSFGGIVFKGRGSSIKIAKLAKGKYCLNYDNSFDEFVKK